MNHNQIPQLLALNANIKIAHWQADSLTNAHKTLGDLYDQLAELIDQYAELVLGIDGNRDIPEGEFELAPNTPVGDLISDAIDLVKATADESKDIGLDNVLADMLNALNRAKYLLKL